MRMACPKAEKRPTSSPTPTQGTRGDGACGSNFLRSAPVARALRARLWRDFLGRSAQHTPHSSAVQQRRLPFNAEWAICPCVSSIWPRWRRQSPQWRVPPCRLLTAILQRFYAVSQPASRPYTCLSRLLRLRNCVHRRRMLCNSPRSSVIEYHIPYGMLAGRTTGLHSYIYT